MKTRCTLSTAQWLPHVLLSRIKQPGYLYKFPRSLKHRPLYTRSLYICMTVRRGLNGVFILVVLVCCFLWRHYSNCIHYVKWKGRWLRVKRQKWFGRGRLSVSMKNINWTLGHSRVSLWDEIKLRISRIRNRNATEIIATFNNTD
jgi:hypothetical protein